MHGDDNSLENRLWERAACGLLLTAADGKILRVNTTFCEWTGYKPEHLENKWRIQDMLSIGGKIFHQTHWAPLLQLQGSVAEVKLDIVTFSGDKVPMMMNAIRRHRDGTECDELALMVVRERNLYERELLIARRSAEQSLAAREIAESQLKVLNSQLSETDRRKDEFLALLAHELRNPLAPIRNALEVLQEIDFPDETADRMRGIVSRQVQQLTRLVDDLLDVARINRGHIEIRRVPLDFRIVAAEAIDPLRPIYAAKNIVLMVEIDDADMSINGDAARLVQVIGNLLNNALKFTDAAGKVHITLKRESGQAVLVVRDTGIGIAEEDLPRLFDLFVQVDSSVGRSQGGLGIGLMLVKFIIEKHDGTTLVRSEGRGRGSEFEIRIPLAVARSTAPVDESQTQQPSSASRRILIVDDSEDGATSMAAYLRFQHHHVSTVFDGEAALALLATQDFDAIVLDIGLPGLDGYEVARRIRSGDRNKTSRLIALTGWGQPSDIRKSMDAGFDLHLVKPVNPRDLAAAVVK